MNTKKTIFMISTVIFLTFLFILLNDGEISQFGQIFQPFLFALTFSISIFIAPSRKFFLVASIVLLILMIFSYLFNLLEVSNWIGSLGFGMLLMTVFSYFNQFIKKGYIEKF